MGKKSNAKSKDKAQKKTVETTPTIPAQPAEKVRHRLEVTIDGTTYKSRSDAARALVAAGKSIGETATAVGMTYQTVFAVTKGKEKRQGNYIKRRAIALGATSKFSEGMLAEKLGISAGQVRSIMNENEIHLPTKAEIDKQAKEASEAKAKKIAEKKEEALKAREQKKAEKEAAKKAEAEAKKAEKEAAKKAEETSK